MIYADYDFYTDFYFGTTIPESDFTRLSLRASQYLDYITQNRAESSQYTEALKMACCALAEQYQTVEAARAVAAKALVATDGAELQSQSVGSWSQSYRSGGDSAQAAQEAARAAESELYNTAQKYLAHTGLLYRGGRCSR